MAVANQRDQRDQREMNLKKRPQDVRHPAFVVRAPDATNRGRWRTLGYAWTRKNGEEGYTIKLNSVPVGSWDGALILLPPFGDDLDAARQTEQ
jgi:hypothetical protein